MICSSSMKVVSANSYGVLSTSVPPGSNTNRMGVGCSTGRKGEERRISIDDNGKSVQQVESEDDTRASKVRRKDGEEEAKGSGRGSRTEQQGADATEEKWIESAQSTEELVNTAESKGIIDGQFKELESLYSSDGEMDEIITTYIDHVRNMLSELESYLSKDEPEFQDARSILHALRGTSATFGAKLVLEAGEGVREHCKQCDASSAYSGNGGFLDLQRAFELMRHVINRYSELEREGKQTA